tara:strand:- start:456 stop:923 length:468 start_codon:yes stop_codon:yes gene_type:complete
MTNVLLVLILFSFWTLLSGHYTPLLLTLGITSVLTVTWLKMRMDKADNHHIHLRPTFNLIKYFLWLYGQVVLANFAVSKRILSRKLDIQPTWEPLDTNLESNLQITFYANSITLTPDTFTTNITDGKLMIHSLWSESYESLQKGEMESRLRKTGI